METQKEYSLWDLLKKILKSKFAELSDKAAVLAIKKMRNDQKMKDYEELIGILETQTVQVGFRVEPPSEKQFQAFHAANKTSSTTDYSSTDSSSDDIGIMSITKPQKPIEEKKMIIPPELLTSSDYSSDEDTDDEKIFPIRIVKNNRKTIFYELRKELNTLEHGLYYKLWVIWDQIERQIKALTMITSPKYVKRLDAYIEDLTTPAKSMVDLHDKVSMIYQYFMLTTDEMIKENDLETDLIQKTVKDFEEFWKLVELAYNKSKSQEALKQ